ncbi:MAG: hydroxyphenylacetyl-CoA thioesterase PaaI [Pseudomonadota bacterium]|nr:hydroxyphenylacetyl-CoA thioesterase PaaI [Pseudomonadota bacterium]
MTPQQTAEQVRQQLYERDHAAQHLGMAVTAIGPDSASVMMTVAAHMLNGHAICHGGLIATLADTAFAYACNAGNQMTVASGFAIELLAPARLGEVLTASATEVSRKGRTGVYDVEVRNAEGDHVAAFRGRSYAIKGRPAVGE